MSKDLVEAIRAQTRGCEAAAARSFKARQTAGAFLDAYAVFDGTDAAATDGDTAADAADGADGADGASAAAATAADDDGLAQDGGRLPSSSSSYSSSSSSS